MAYTGLTGKVEINKAGSTAKEIMYISNWSIEDTTDVIEVTKLGNGFKEKLPGLQSWSGSADGAVEFDTDNGQSALFASKHNGDEVTCTFYLDSNANVAFSGTGIIESLSVDLSAEDKGNISISISGIGKLTSTEE